MSRPKVFCVQQNQHDYSAAEKFGDLCFILPFEANLALVTQPMVRRLRDALRSFTPRDYLLLTGDPIAIGAAVSIASKRFNEPINLLKWDREMQTYLHIVLDLTSHESYVKEALR